MGWHRIQGDLAIRVPSTILTHDHMESAVKVKKKRLEEVVTHSRGLDRYPKEWCPLSQAAGACNSGEYMIVAYTGGEGRVLHSCNTYGEALEWCRVFKQGHLEADEIVVERRVET